MKSRCRDHPGCRSFRAICWFLTGIDLDVRRMPQVHIGTEMREALQACTVFALAIASRFRQLYLPKCRFMDTYARTGICRYHSELHSGQMPECLSTPEEPNGPSR